MKLPYFKQETNYTCGAACMRMILASYGIKKSEKQISKLLKVNKIIGTWHKNLSELAEKYKLNYLVERDASLSQLRKLKKQRWKIIVNYYWKKFPHYSLVNKINWHSIYLTDPARSDKIRYFIPRFKKVWHDGQKEKKWFIAIKYKGNNRIK